MRTKNIDARVLLVNDISDSSCGGAAEFYKGEIIAKLEPGIIGFLEIA